MRLHIKSDPFGQILNDGIHNLVLVAPVGPVAPVGYGYQDIHGFTPFGCRIVVISGNYIHVIISLIETNLISVELVGIFPEVVPQELVVMIDLWHFCIQSKING